MLLPGRDIRTLSQGIHFDGQIAHQCLHGGHHCIAQYDHDNRLPRRSIFGTGIG